MPRRIAILTVLVTVLVGLGAGAPATRASAGEVDVGDKGGGLVEGVHDTDGQSGKPSGGPGAGSAGGSGSAVPVADDDDPEPVTNCDRGRDGELLTPWDCPVEPVDDLDEATAAQLARRLVVRLKLPRPTPQVGPDPSANDWNLAVVGYPLWLWTEGTRTVSATVSGYGHTFTLTARHLSTTFEPGDGHRVVCEDTTAYPARPRPASPSPTCGHTYTAASHGSLTLRATTHWMVTWRVEGLSGTLAATHTATRDLVIGELAAAVTARVSGRARTPVAVR